MAVFQKLTSNTMYANILCIVSFIIVQSYDVRK